MYVLKFHLINIFCLSTGQSIVRWSCEVAMSMRAAKIMHSRSKGRKAIEMTEILAEKSAQGL